MLTLSSRCHPVCTDGSACRGLWFEAVVYALSLWGELFGTAEWQIPCNGNAWTRATSNDQASQPVINACRVTCIT
jgi:hypothetical protein